MDLPSRDMMVAHLVLQGWEAVSTHGWVTGVRRIEANVNNAHEVVQQINGQMYHDTLGANYPYRVIAWDDLDDALLMAIYMLLNAGVKDG